MLHNSNTQLIQFTDRQKVAKNWLEQLTDQIEKAKKVLENLDWTFHKLSVSEHVKKNFRDLLTWLTQFTD